MGSGTILTNPHGEASQVLSYMPFGETLLNVTDQTYTTPYRFTGHEKDEESGLHYAHARYLSTDLSIFLSVDPMYMKYPSLTPYHYCGNNPVARVDPSGMEIVITGEDDTKIVYKPGMQYDGSNKFIAQTIDALNDINCTEAGSVVINSLVISSNICIITNGKSIKAAHLKKTENGTQINMNNSLNVLDYAHELFHSYQYENNHGGKTVNNEIGARLFASVIDDQLFPIPKYDAVNGKGTYADAMAQLLFNGFSKETYAQAINTFFESALAGPEYKELGYKISDILENPSIKQFIPIK